MSVFVQSRVQLVPVTRPLERVASKILSAVGESRSELSIAFVGDRLMRRLNRRYRDKDGTTDVLAFAVREGPLADVRQLGDVVISLPAAIRQAKEGGRSLDIEVATLLVHGILHLCGYDHERNDAEARRMQRKEQAILRSLMPLPKIINRSRHTARGTRGLAPTAQ